MKLIFLVILTSITNFCFAQSDTTYFYFTQTGANTNKDSAHSYIKMYKQNGVWHGVGYYTKNNILQSEGDYDDSSVNIPIGTFNNYKETGALDFKASYIKGKPTEATYFYKNGDKKSFISFDEERKVKKQKGWDESGKEIKNYIVTQQASFKGGAPAWQKFLQKKVGDEVASAVNIPAGQFTVIVEFGVSADGSVFHAKAVSIPDSCKPCGRMATSVIMSSPDWQPAIFQNEPVATYFNQPVTFMISEEKGSKKKRGV